MTGTEGITDLVVTASFKRMISLPGYQNMEASITLAGPVPKYLSPSEFGQLLQDLAADLALSELRKRLYAIASQKGVLAFEFSRLMRCLEASPEDLMPEPAPCTWDEDEDSDWDEDEDSELEGEGPVLSKPGQGCEEDDEIADFDN